MPSNGAWEYSFGTTEGISSSTPVTVTESVEEVTVCERVSRVGGPMSSEG